MVSIVNEYFGDKIKCTLLNCDPFDKCYFEQNPGGEAAQIPLLSLSSGEAFSNRVHSETSQSTTPKSAISAAVTTGSSVTMPTTKDITTTTAGSLFRPSTNSNGAIFSNGNSMHVNTTLNDSESSPILSNYTHKDVDTDIVNGWIGEDRGEKDVEDKSWQAHLDDKHTQSYTQNEDGENGEFPDGREHELGGRKFNDTKKSKNINEVDGYNNDIWGDDDEHKTNVKDGDISDNMWNESKERTETYNSTEQHGETLDKMVNEWALEQDNGQSEVDRVNVDEIDNKHKLLGDGADMYESLQDDSWNSDIKIRKPSPTGNREITDQSSKDSGPGRYNTTSLTTKHVVVGTVCALLVVVVVASFIARYMRATRAKASYRRLNDEFNVDMDITVYRDQDKQPLYCD